jgi:hypothetical protein
MMILRFPRSFAARLMICCAAAIAAVAAVTALGAPKSSAPPPPAAAIDDAPDCELTYARALEVARKMRASHPDWVWREYVGGDAQKIVDKINEVEPKSDWRADRVLVIDPHAPFYNVGISVNGCVEHAFNAPRDAWDTLVNDALGDGA